MSFPLITHACSNIWGGSTNVFNKFHPRPHCRKTCQAGGYNKTLAIINSSPFGTGCMKTEIWDTFGHIRAISSALTIDGCFHCAHSWTLAPRSVLYEWMGVALVTGHEAVVTALGDRAPGAPSVRAGLEGNITELRRHFGRDNERRRGEERRERESPLPSEDWTSGDRIWWDLGTWVR